MELMMVVSITAVIVVTVTGLFFRSLRGGAKTDTIATVEQNSQYVLALMERFIRNAKEVNNVGGLPCPSTGQTVTLIGWDGGTTQFSLSSGRIASNSTPLSADNVLVENLTFECVRDEGVPDQIVIDFDATRSDVGTGFVTSTHFETKVALRNFQ